MKDSLTTNEQKSRVQNLPIQNEPSDWKNIINHLWHMVDFPRQNTFDNMEPKIQVAENKANVIVSAEMPGVEEKDIDLEISSEGYLTISAEKKNENSSQDKNNYFSEITYGMVQRTVPLPWDLDFNKAQAAYCDGVLKVTFPKIGIEKPKVKKINVKKSAGIRKKKS